MKKWNKVMRIGLLTVLLSLLCSALILSASAASTWSGNGTSSSPWLISSESDLRLLSSNVKAGNTYSGKYFKVSSNISLTQTWIPIGTATTSFRGSFDGNGKTISGMAVECDYSGLFAYVGSGAVIKNVKLTGFTVSGVDYRAGLVAYADAGTGSIVIENCTVSGALNDSTPTDDYESDDYEGYAEYMGGIVAYADASNGSITISGCTSSGTFVCDASSGGIVGYGEGSDESLRIIGCTNYAAISAGSNSDGCGGIAGYILDAWVEGCVNFGGVSGNAYSEDNGSSWLGGIAGRAGGVTFQMCANHGSVSTFFAGGITAYQGINQANYCLNTGSLNYSSDGYGCAIIRYGTVSNSYYSKGPGVTGATSVTSNQLASGKIAWVLGEWFGQTIGTDSYPMPRTESNRVFRVTVVGELNQTYYVNSGNTVSLPSCVTYKNGSTTFNPATPIEADYSLIAGGANHVMSGGVCTVCGETVSDFADYGTCGTGVVWTLSESGVLTVSGSGAMADYATETRQPWHEYAESIVSVTVEKGVTSIGKNAFYGLSAMNTLTIADGVTAIGDYAFYGCSALTSVTVPGSVTTIGNYAFSGCSGLTSATVTNGVTTINSYAFYGCSALTSVTIPNSVTAVGNYAFSGCSNLRSVSINAAATSVGSYAFANCTSLKNIYVYGALSSVGSKAFYGCSAVESISFTGGAPSSVSTDAFSGVSAYCVYKPAENGWTSSVTQNYGGTLTWVLGYGRISDIDWVITPNGVLTFSGSGDMYSLGTSYWYGYSEYITSVVVESGITSIGSYGFYNLYSATEISLPDTITSIGNYAFMGCVKLTDIHVDSANTAFCSVSGVLFSKNQQKLVCYPAAKSGSSYAIPSGVTEISYSAFYNCVNLTEVTIPSGVTYIRDYAFDDCSALRKITFQGSAPTISSYVFSGVTAEVYFPASNTSWSASLLKNYGGKLTWKTASGSFGTNLKWELNYVNGGGVLSITGSGAMPNYTADSPAPWSDYSASIDTVTVGSGVTSVGDYAFKGYSALKTVTLADSVTSVGTYAFYDCTKLANLTLVSGLKTISDYAFTMCDGLITVTIPDSVTSIGVHAFSSSENISTLVIGNGVTTIGNYAFSGCSKLSNLTIGSKVETIGNRAFSTNKALTSLTIPNGVKTVGQYAFYNCTGLRSIVVGTGVTEIQTYAFSGCTGLEYVDFKGNAPTFGSYAFQNATAQAYYNSSKSGWTASGVKGNYGGKLTWGVITAQGFCGTGAEWILNDAGDLLICGTGYMTDYSASTPAPWAAYKTSIKTVTVGSGVYDIGNYAFYGCTALTRVTVNRTGLGVGSYAFADCSALRLVSFSGNGGSFGTDCFANVNADMWYSSSATGWSTSLRKDYGGKLTWRSVSTSGTCGTTAYWALSGSTLVVQGYGAMGNYSSSSMPWYSNLSSITSAIIGEGITSVGNYAFYGASKLASISLPESLTSIGQSAFRSNALTTITIPANVDSIASSAFSYNSSVTTITFKGKAPTTINSSAFGSITANVYYPATDSSWTSSKQLDYGGTLTWKPYAAGTFGENLTWELTDAGTLIITGTGDMPDCGNASNVPWYNCSNQILKVEIGSGITSIGDRAFMSYSKLTSVTIPNTVTDIGEFAFYYCSSLTSVTLPNSVQSIGDDAFYGCSALTKLTLGSGLKTIGTYAFRSCTGLTAVTLPEGLTSLGNYAFQSCTGLTSITLPGSLTSLGDYVFDACSSLTTAIIPNTLTSTGNYTFRNCTKLTSVTVGTGVVTVGDRAFYGCSALESIELPATVKTINIAAFGSCSELKSIVIPEKVTSIASWTFYNCTALKDVVFLGSAPNTISNDAFSGVTAIVRYPSNSSWTSSKQLDYGGTLTWQVLPSGSCGSNVTWKLDHEGVLTISGTGPMNDYVVGETPWSDYLADIKRVVIAEGVTSIGNEVFCTCTTFTSVVIPNSVTSIGEYAFEGCTGLTTLTLGSGLTEIGNYAFYGCSGITAVTFPESVTSIGGSAFKNCTALKSITFTGRAPESVGSNAFGSVTATVYYPVMKGGWTESVRANYGGTLTWSNRDTIPAPVVSTALDEYRRPAITWTAVDGANGYVLRIYQGNTLLATQKLSETVFSHTDVSASTTYSYTVATVVEGVEGAAGSRVSVTVPKTFLTAFGTCGENLTWTLDNEGTLTITGTGEMADYTLYTQPWLSYREDIKFAVINEGVTSIGNATFKGCSSLTAIEIPKGVTSIGDYAFCECSSLTSVEIPEGVTSIGTGAFRDCTDLSAIVVPEGVTSIGNSVFYECTSLTTVTICNGATSIGAFAFRGCTSLTDITLPNSVTGIEENAFVYCTALTEIIIPDNVTYIDFTAFKNCTSLSKITIPNRVASIGFDAFWCCSALSEIVFEGDAPWFGEDVFQSVTATCYYPANNATWTDSKFQDYGGTLTWVVDIPVIVAQPEDVEVEDGEEGSLSVTATGRGLTYRWYFRASDEDEWTPSAATGNQTATLTFTAALEEDGYQYYCVVTDVNGKTTASDVVTVTVSSPWVASGECGANLAWTLDEEGTLTITGTGQMYDYLTDGTQPWYSHREDIKSLVIGDGVTSIGIGAFRDCRYLEEVMISDSVESIRGSAFSGCTSLAEINIPDSVESIGSSAFQDCTSLTEINIPDGVGSIDTSTFDGCTSLTEIIIPSSVESIGNLAFGGCTSLAEITIPSSVESIGNLAFGGCTSLKEINIPDSVNSIGNHAFRECTSLAGVNIPVSVNSIGMGVFSGCTALTEINIPDSVISIGDFAFQNCTSLASVTIPDGVETIGFGAFGSCKAITKITIPDSVKSIGESAFSACFSLKEIIFVGDAPEFGDYVFSNSSVICYYPVNNATWTDEVRQFYGGAVVWRLDAPVITAQPEDVEVEDGEEFSLSVTATGRELTYQWYFHASEDEEWVASDAEGNQTNTLTFVATEAENGYQYYCVMTDANGTTADSDVVTVTVSSWVASGECGDNLTWTLDKDGTLAISGTGEMEDYTSSTQPWCAYKGDIKSVVINEGVTSIGDYAFSSCTGLTSVEILEGVTSIGDNAFSICISLTEIVIPEGVTDIGSYAFSNCSSLTSVGIPGSATGTGDWAFYRCDSLTSIVIPEGVTSIGSSAFAECGSLTSIEIPESMTSIGSSAFRSCSSLTEIVIPEGVTSIGGGAFNGCSSLTTIEIPEGVIEIGSLTFYFCTGLTEIVIPESVTSIGDNAFEVCSNLISIEIPKGVASIGSSAFKSCSSLTAIEIPVGVTSIGDYTFSGCSSLTEIVIPESVTSIGAGAFSGCSSLTEIVIPEGVTSIGNGALQGCSGLTSINIPKSVTSIGNNAFLGCAALSAFVVDEDNPSYSSADGVLFDKDQTTLIRYPASKAGETYAVPGTVTTIKDRAFQDSAFLTTITVPKSVTSVGTYILLNCPTIQKVVFAGNAPQFKATTFYDTTATCYYPGNNDTWTEEVRQDYGGELTWIKDLPEITSQPEDKSMRDGEDVTLSVSAEGNELTYQWYVRASEEDEWEPSTATGNQTATLTFTADDAENGFQYYCAVTGITGTTTDSDVATVTVWVDFGTCGENLTWTLDDKGTLTISGTGEMINNTQPWSSCVEKINFVVIKAGVTSIGNSVFTDCTALTEITIPASVTSIGYSAFSSCSSLTEIVIPASVTSIGNSAFFGCSGLTEIVIPESVTSIEFSTFENCSNLTDIVIPDSVASIGNSAFYGCSSLTEIVIPEGVTFIGDRAFRECFNLTSVIIPDSVADIGNYAFESCSSLTSVTFEGDAPKIGSYAFLTVTATAYYPGNNQTWTEDVLLDYGGELTWGSYYTGTCGENLTWLLKGETLTISGSGKMPNYSEGTAPWYKHRLKIEKVVLEEGVTSIGNYAFWSCSKLTEITILEGVTSIGNDAFYGCSSLTEITIPEGVTSIGTSAFYGCSSLTEIVLPEGVTSIGNYAFKGCSNLTTVTLPEGVSSIGIGAFYGCSSLTSVIIPEGVEIIGYDAFYRCSSLTSVIIPESVPSIGSATFKGCSSLTSVTIPKSVSSIGGSAFSGCSSLTEITIPEGVTSIGDYAFYGCSSLCEIVFAGNAPTFSESSVFGGVTATCSYPCGNETWTEEVLEDYGGELTWKNKHNFVDGACEGCGAITGTCDKNLTWTLDNEGTLTVSGTGEMEDYTLSTRPWYYSYKGDIKSVVINEGVTSIGDYAFDNCTNLTEIVIPESVTSIGAGAFSGCSSLTEIVIPDSVTSIGNVAFLDCTALKSIVIPNSVTYIGSSAFHGCTALQSATLGSGVETIGRGAFYDCTALQSIVIPGSVTSIGSGTFAECTALQSVTLVSGVETIGSGAFQNCSALTSLTIPNSVTSIGSDTFSFCSSLTSIVIPDSVTTIGNYAFFYCTALQSVTLGSGVETIGSGTFLNCTALESIVIPDSVTSIGDNAFFGCTGLTSVDFEGDAPEIGDDAFNGVTATAYYPGNNQTWTEDVLLDYGGELTWLPDVPVITAQPVDAVSVEGEKVTFSVSATGAISYQWQYKTPTGAWTNSPATGNKTAALTVPVTQSRNGYQYRCVVTGAVGSVTSDAATLTVAVKTAITSQPESVTAEVGNTVTFTVSASGTGLKYQWQYKTPTGAWTNSPATGNKTAILTVPVTQDRNGNQYRCIVSGAGGSVTSNAATLTVQTVAKPVITSQPVSKTVGAADPVSFSVVATGEGLKYQWQYKTPTGVWTNNTCTAATFSLTKAENFRNGYQYRCAVTNDGGTVYSDVVTLTVVAKPMISAQPESVTAKVGDTVTFTVSASGTGLTYQWQYKTPTGAWTNSPATGNKTAILTVPVTQDRNGNQYRCVVSNVAGSVTSNAATLTVQTVARPVITSQPVSKTVGAADPVSFSVVATGEALKYQWQYKTPTGVWTNNTCTAATFSLTKAENFRNGYQYRCAVTNDGGTVYSDVVVLTIAAKPVISAQPESVTAKVGDTVTYTVSATGTNLTYQWQYKTLTGVWTKSPATGNKTATLTVPVTQDRNGNQYRCVVSNAAGSVTSNAATLTVQTVAKPVITSQPVSKTVGAADPVSFTVVATGESLKYQWQYKTPTGVWTNNTCTAATFSLSKAENFRNGYQYRCAVTNDGGTVYSDVVVLTIAAKPVISAQPVSVTAKAGDTVTYTVSATGTNLTYQWQYKTPTGEWTNSPADGNKTASLAVPATSFRNGYQYRCVVSNAAGSVTSNAAALTVK